MVTNVLIKFRPDLIKTGGEVAFWKFQAPYGPARVNKSIKVP